MDFFVFQMIAGFLGEDGERGDNGRPGAPGINGGPGIPGSRGSIGDAGYPGRYHVNTSILWCLQIRITQFLQIKSDKHGTIQLDKNNSFLRSLLKIQVFFFYVAALPKKIQRLKINLMVLIYDWLKR